MDKEKAVEALVYIAREFPRVGRFHASKILYFAERKHLREYGRPIVGDRYIAMENGPVPSFAYDVLRGTVVPDDRELVIGALRQNDRFRHPAYEAEREPDLDVFSATDIECLNWAIEHCRLKTFGAISDETHTHVAWDRARLNGPMSFDDFMDGADPDVVEDAEEFASYGVL
ncbi:Panacea domain-containing protein [Labrys sp. (in: a-proteobacteria)]|uniref:Panacea domain-containing protein n=1 Tax=Labrys sp. (in: a-proteobacteria) TaxID=1917972 RepID=UPI0039E474AE